ncbi:hypothetical protein PR202_ga19259 [Eleusine coracana subsp. coracana]|uniref:Uncharacterized protein n=1 Tax=Eleusine coracana subsp. coracana TaxID=191504 RepID=A0AAV5CV41_ELECO|nr:hypothetical protein PR202_ga19259 [Eleusine coracana subsp. coracana]
MIGRGGAGGSGVQRKNAGQEWPNLVDVILSWSLQDVMNEGLFKGKVKRIPSTFSNLKSYLEFYTSPLLEELRTEMSSSLESLSTMPFVKISWIEQKKGNGRYEIYVDACPQKAKSSNKAECYAPSVGDIVILSDVKMGHISDITRNGRPYRIAFITVGGDEDDDSPLAKYDIIASGKIDAADRKVTNAPQKCTNEPGSVNSTEIWRKLSSMNLNNSQNDAVLNYFNHMFRWNSMGDEVKEVFLYNDGESDSRKSITSSKNIIRDFCIESASIIFCTVSSSSKVTNKKLELLVIDEAAQLKECETLIPLRLPALKHSILIGDECQLPATVKSKVCTDALFGRSLFERFRYDPEES